MHSGGGGSAVSHRLACDDPPHAAATSMMAMTDQARMTASRGAAMARLYARCRTDRECRGRRALGYRSGCRGAARGQLLAEGLDGLVLRRNRQKGRDQGDVD